IQYYNQRGYGSDAAQALTLGKNISIEEYYIGNIRYWWLPDGTEIYPENYDGTLVPYDELILYSQYGGLEKAGLHGQIIQGKRIDLKDNSVFYYDAQGNFAGTKKKAGLTAYEISPVTEDGEFIDRQEFALAILNTGKIKKLQTDYQTAHPDSHFEDKYDEDGTWIINNIALTPQKDNGEVLTLAELEGLAAKTYQVTPEDILIAQAALADVKETAVSDEVSNSANQIAQPDDVSASQSNAALTANESAQAAAPKVESAPTTTNESASATAAAPTTTNESASAAAAAQAAAPEIESEQETTNEPAPAAEITDKLKEFYDNNKVLSFILAFLLIWLPIWIIAKKKNSSNKNGSDGRLKVSVFPVIEILRWMFQDIAELIINKKQNKQEPKEEQPSAIYLFTGGSYAQAYALQKQGLKTAVVERVYSAPAKHKKLTPRWPNSVVQIKRGRKTYEFTIEYYIPSAAQDSNKPLSIKALISNVSTRKGNDFSKLPRDAQTLLMRDAYILSHRQLAQNIEDDAKHLQKRLSANSVGAVFYKTFGANNGAQTPFLEVSENGREKYFYGSRETNNIEILLNDVLAAKEHFKSRSFKGHAYGVSLNAAKRKNLSDKKKTDKFISKTVSQNISILKVESENPAQVIEDLWKKRKTEDSVKFQNVLSSDASVQKILTLNSTDLNERLLRRIFALGFNGVYLKTQKDDIESSLDLVSSFSPQNARNFIELTSKEALDFQDAVKNANFVPAVKISKTKPDIAKALEGMENAAVIIDSFVSGDELAGAREKISAVFLKSAQSALKDKSDINALTKNKALKIYKAALEHAKKSPLTSQDITSPEILDAYAQEPQNDNFSQKDFDELKEALTAAGVPKESALAKYIESAPNDIFGFAASKAYLKAAIEKQRAKTAPVSKSAKIKSFFTQLFTIIPYKFKFPKVFASAARFNGVSSIEDLKNKISQLSKNNVVNLEFNLEVKENQIFVQIERTRSERTLLPLRQVLDAAANNRKAKILFNAAQINQDFSFFFEEASRYPANVSLITSDADLIVKYRQIYPDINFIFEINGVSDYETFKNIVSKNTKSVSLNKALYEIFKDSLSQEINSVLPEIFIKTNADEENYNAYLSDNKNEINLISDTPAESQKGYAKARAASGNIKSLPFLLLITQLDLFISFWTLFVENAGHSLALINTAVAIAAPFFILSTFAAKYLSSTIGQRNAVITYLTLQIAGSAILYFVGFSPAFVILYVVIPVFAQGGIQTLFTPFMQSALIAIDKLDKAESIDAKSRSFLWKGVGLGILSGGALAAAFGQPNVIILSTILLTAMLVYVLANSKTIERVQDIVEETQEMANGIKNKIKKYAAGFKAAFNNYVSDIKSLLKNKTLIQILVSTTLVEVLMTAVVPIEAPSIIVGIGFAVPAIAVIYFIGNMLQSFISEIAAKDNFAKLRSLIKNKTARSLYWASMSVVALAFAFTHNPVIFLAFFALIEIFLALSQTIESSYVAQNVDENKSESLYNVKLISDAALSALFTLMIARFGGDSSQDLSLLGKIIFAVTAVSFAATLAVSAAYIKFGKPSIFKKKTNRDYTYKILQSA
ncbi:MAG: MFS transporter, partial [Endomicrobium sp.]|nr:MFS transporter [Endomicrobium sp.]